MHARRRWSLLVALIGLSLLVAWLNIERVERAYIGWRIYRAAVFTPPPAAGESTVDSLAWNAEAYWDLAGLRIARDRRAKLLDPELHPLVKEIARRQAAGRGMQYSMHIYREVRWRLSFTPDVATTRARIDDLRKSLDQDEMQQEATEQQASDGSWGLGFDVWYLRLYYSVEDGLKSGAEPRYPMTLLDRINSPATLTAQLDSALFDDFTRTDEFKREELDETFSALARLLYGERRTSYAFDPGLKGALRAFVDTWQNPATGCWGPWVVDRHGRTWKMDDTGITFHVISDLHGQVDHLDRVANRLLDLKDRDFPAGPRMNGHDENHLNWDMVTVFRYAWPSMDEPTRARARNEIARMLSWCLGTSLLPDGSFKTSDLDDTVGDAYFYGVSFLRDVGYFDRALRFWTDQELPDADGVRSRIASRIRTMGTSDPGVKSAYEALERTR